MPSLTLPTTFSPKMAEHFQSRQQQPWLVIDFDGTCTERDTTPLLPKIAATFSKDDEMTRKKRMATFASLESEYFSLYEAAKDLIFRDENNAGDSGTALMPLDDALDILDAASNAVTHRVSESRVLEGIPHCPDQMADLIDQDGDVCDAVRLRQGCAAALACAASRGWRLGVLSINWCPPLIEAALVRHLRNNLELNQESEPTIDIGVRGTSENNSASFQQPPPAVVDIWSNVVDINGVVELHVPGAVAKKARIAALRRQAQHQSALVVYIGDSTTDLAALIEADMGVIIGGSNSVAAFANRWGITLSPLSEWRREQHWKPSSLARRTIWVVERWDEIEKLLVDLSLSPWWTEKQ